MAELIDCEKEKWKSIESYEGKYLVSNKGCIKSVKRCLVRSNGRPQHIKERILKPSSDEWGYPQVRLDGHTFKVHRLVAIAFLGKRPSENVIRHRDGNPKNNSITNLVYGTASENVLDCYDYRGVLSKRQKLSPENAKEIRKRLFSGERGKDLATEYGVSPQNICDIKNGRTFAWIGEKV